MPCTTGFINTREFSPVALGKEKCPPRKTNYYEWREWWIEQRRRSREGFSVGGVKITGPHYHYLNFLQILRVGDRGGSRKELLPPRFIDLDYDKFWAYHNARYIDKKRGLAITGSRQRGKTMFSAALAAHEFHFFRKSQTLIVAYDEEYANDTFRLFLEYCDQLMVTEWRKSRQLKDTADEVMAGRWVRDPITKDWIPKGYRSTAHKLVAKNNFQCTIGKTPSLVLREESGKYPNYLQQADYMKSQLESEGQQTGFSLDFGTGGAMTTGGSTGLKTIYWNPGRLNYAGFDEQWSDEGDYIEGGGKLVSFFIPAHRGLIMDENGNSLKEPSLKKMDHDRALAEAESDDALYNLTSQEPKNPKESFYVQGGGVLPVKLLNRRLAKIESSAHLQKIIQRGDLDFIVNSEREVIGIEWTANKEGVFHILEHPEWTRPFDPQKPNRITRANGFRIYKSGVDSYDQDTSTTGSIGSQFIYKKFINADLTGNLFVAQYSDRPDADDFYENTFKLNYYYNCKMLFEATNVGIKQWYINNNKVIWLKEKPEIAYQNIKESRADYTYGLQMPAQIKTYGVTELKKWLRVYYDNLYFTDQINDMINFTYDTNHDRTIASMLCIIQELDDARLDEQQEQEQTTHTSSYTTYKRVNGRLVHN